MLRKTHSILGISQRCFGHVFALTAWNCRQTPFSCKWSYMAGFVFSSLVSVTPHLHQNSYFHFSSSSRTVLFIILFPANYWFPSAEQITVAGWGIFFPSGNWENLYKKQVFSRLILLVLSVLSFNKAWLEIPGFISRECTDKRVRSAFHQFLAAELMYIFM